EGLTILRAYLAIERKIEAADAIFCFGGSTIAPAVKAAELYHARVAQAIFSLADRGAFSDPESTEPECEIYRRVLRHASVPGEHVFMEARCTNTLQEASLAVEFM